MSCAKTAEPIEMPFGAWTRVSPRNRVQVLDENPARPGEPGKGQLGHLLVYCEVRNIRREPKLFARWQ